MKLEDILKKHGYIKWERLKDPSDAKEVLTRLYKEENKWKIEYYIKNEKIPTYSK